MAVFIPSSSAVAERDIVVELLPLLVPLPELLILSKSLFPPPTASRNC